VLISNNNRSYLRFNRTPIDNMLRFLTKHFHPKRIQEGYSLAISGTDKSVARINHDHERQFAYVQQSLRLWQAISNGQWAFSVSRLCRQSWQFTPGYSDNPGVKSRGRIILQGFERKMLATDMFRLWTLAEQDLLGSS